MALILDSVSYTYGAGTAFAERALAGVSLCAAQGEFVLVLGATGSGKSTLLRVAAGLLEADQGVAEIDGVPLTRASARGAVGLVFQDAESQLFAETVIDDVAFGPRNLGASSVEAAQRARLALAAVGLDPETFSARSPFGLSGGEARRAAIAGVLAMDPRYVLLDEPTSGLDARGRAAVREVLRVARRKTGIVVVSHGAEEFLGEADRVLVLSQGSTAFAGTGAALVADPGQFGAAGLVAPDVLRFQVLAREHGCDVGALTLDPDEAAERVCRGGGWS